MERFVLMVFVALATSCATPPKRAAPAIDSFGDSIVPVWIENDSGLPVDVLLAGCAYWQPFKIRCERTMDIKAARVRVRADKTKCNTEDKIRKLAWAKPGGEIVMEVDCLKDFFGRFDRKLIRITFAHELGHELGIWDHVPSTCDPKEVAEERKVYDKYLTVKKHPGGKQVCGTAVMNPWIHDLSYLTEIDGLAFDLRDKYWRVVTVPDEPPPGWNGCVLYAK